jgi:hypothetical protein
VCARGLQKLEHLILERNTSMNFSWKKTSALAAAAALTTAGLSAISFAPANAADAKPQDAHITLISPVLNADNTSEAAANQGMADGWVHNGWFGTGLVFQRAFAPVGSSINMVYHVTDKDGKPLVNQDVKLRINKGYSVSTSILKVDDQTTKGVDKPPLDQADVIHKTDAYGNVAFLVQDLDQAPLGEPQPASLTAAPNISSDGLNDLHSQMLAEVAGEKPDHSVITEFHYYIPDAQNPLQPVGGITAPSIRQASPVLDDTNSIHRTDLEKTFSVDNNWYAQGMTFRQAYAAVGSKTVLTYIARDDAGNVLPNTVVKVHVNKGYSKSNAKVTNGTVATDPTKDDSAGNDQALWTGTTDPFGAVVFSLQNTDTNGEPTPATPTTAVPTDASAVFSQIYPEIAGQGADKADMVEFHFYGQVTPPVVKTITVKATEVKKTAKVKGKTVVSYSINLVVTNAAGKKATIAITGAKAVSKSIMAASQAFTFATTKGTKVVTVTIAGKAYKTSVVIK